MNKADVMNDLSPNEYHLTSRYQLMSDHQLIKLFGLHGWLWCLPSVPLVPITDVITRVISVTRQSNYLQSKYSYEYCSSQLWLAC
jgi:hypothetical protein